MLEFLFEYGLFLAKSVTVLVVILVVIGSVAALAQKNKPHHEGHIEVKHLNQRFDKMRDVLREAVWSATELKKQHKLDKKKDKQEKKREKKHGETDQPAKKHIYVLKFDGDLKASAAENLRQEITAVLTLAGESDEVVVNLESSGGMVHTYGFAASQLDRVKNRNIPLTVCVDKVAASGGYMMACIADKILAAPFAVMGSIGVVAQIPNFHRLLKKNEVDVEMLTAGEYKRTLTIFGENTERDRDKFRQDLEDTHLLFKEFVKTHRPVVDIEQVATGETWYGTRALGKKLVDALQTSDEYLLQQSAAAEIYAVTYREKKSIQERFGMVASGVVDRTLIALWERLSQRWKV